MSWRFSLCYVAMALLVHLTSVASAADPSLVDNPAYKAWTQYQPGTRLTLACVRQDAKDSSTTIAIMKLVSITPEKAVIEEVDTVQAGNAMPAFTVEIPAKIASGRINLPHEVADDAAAQAKETRTGQETVEINGQKILAQTHEFTLKSHSAFRGDESGTLKVWTSPAIPGYTVVSDTDITSPSHVRFKNTVTGYEIQK